MKALLVLALTAVAGLASAQSMDKGAARPLAQVKFAQDDDVKCLASALENGDPGKGASTFILKAPPNCVVPWHYHTAEEQLIVVQGTVLTEMEGMSARALAPGGFAMMPGKAKHQFSCQSKSPCILFVMFDRTYDIFWVKDAKASVK
ncbi:MAG: cupin domain-containing protein [Bryobacteraceae bacterium]|jgi:quercetin dioxygenase-like cupin family protein